MELFIGNATSVSAPIIKARRFLLTSSVFHNDRALNKYCSWKDDYYFCLLYALNQGCRFSLKITLRGQ